MEAGRETVSGSCPRVGFDINCVVVSGSAVTAYAPHGWLRKHMVRLWVDLGAAKRIVPWAIPSQMILTRIC
jgi:hypothetical protein